MDSSEGSESFRETQLFFFEEISKIFLEGGLRCLLCQSTRCASIAKMNSTFSSQTYVTACNGKYSDRSGNMLIVVASPLVGDLVKVMSPARYTR